MVKELADRGNLGEALAAGLYGLAAPTERNMVRGRVTACSARMGGRSRRAPDNLQPHSLSECSP